MNRAREYLDSVGEPIAQYEGFCLELADEVLWFINDDSAQIIYLDAPNGGVLFPTVSRSRWSYHAAVFLDGLVHDAWLEEALPVKDYLRKMFRNDTINATYYIPERQERWVRKEALDENPDLSRQAWG